MLTAQSSGISHDHLEDSHTSNSLLHAVINAICNSHEQKGTEPREESS